MASAVKTTSTLKLIKDDPWLEPYSEAINGRYNYAVEREATLTSGAPLSSFANGHHYFGLLKTETGWSFREWAPNATSICLIGDFNGWSKQDGFWLNKLDNGIWELLLPADTLKHGQLYKMVVEWNGGSG